MEKNQKINCTVCSCEFHEGEKNQCNLEQITVKPYPDCNTQNPDESVCGSYKCCFSDDEK